MSMTIVKTRDGRLDAADALPFEGLLDRLVRTDAPLMFHIHGGLVDQDAGLSIAKRLSGGAPLGYDAPAATEQLYVVWRTGLLETVVTNWPELHAHDRLYRALLGKLLEFFARRVVPDGTGRGAGCDLDRDEIERRLSTEGEAPFADLDALSADADASPRGAAGTTMTEAELEAQLGRELTRNSQVIAAAQDIDAASTPPGGRTPISGDPVAGAGMLRRMDGGPKTAMRAIAAGGTGVDGRGLSATVLRSVVLHGVAIGRRVLQRMKEGRDHGVHATIVEELVRELYGDYVGGAVWGMMRQDAAEHFAADGMGSALLDAIAAGPPRRVMLVGHSAGSIMICRLLLEAVRRGMDRRFEVILLAPAVRSRLFAEALAGAPELIDRFRMFALGDKRERRDAVLGPKTGYLYPSSLLYLVSGLFEDDEGEPFVDAPLLGMQRFRTWAGGSLGEAEDRYSAAVASFLDGQADAAIYAPAHDGSGRSSDATTHGGMDDDPDTLASVGALLR